MTNFIIVCSNTEQGYQTNKTINADTKRKAENIFEKKYGNNFNIVSTITPYIQKKYGNKKWLNLLSIYLKEKNQNIILRY